MISIQEIRNNGYKTNGIEIKNIQNYAVKKILIDNIVASAINEDDGVKRVDYALLDFAIEIGILNQYSNIDLTSDKSSLEIYDELKQYGILDYVLERVDLSEKKSIYNIVDKEIQQIMNEQNNAALQIKRIADDVSTVKDEIIKFLSDVEKKIPSGKQMNNILNKIPEMFNKIKPESKEMIKDVLNINAAANK